MELKGHLGWVGEVLEFVAGNPFNGIERSKLAEAEARFKGEVNPFNGIESISCRGCCSPIGLSSNPFNGIERMSC